MLTIMSILLAGILVVAGLLLAWSYPGRPKPSRSLISNSSELFHLRQH